MSIDKFFSYPVVTVVIINHVPEVYFPAITICNQNMIKADNAENHKIFLELMEASSTGEGTIHWDLYDNVTKGYVWNLTEWAFQDGHKIEDMLLECKWKLHQHCSPKDFRPIMTDFGVCFTYNWDEHNPLPVGHPGSSYGLVLRLNIEQDQYTWSEFGGAGMKVYAHAQGETPLVKMHGFSVGPGMETDITLRYIKRKNLKSPYKPYCDEKQLKYSHIYNAELCRFECEVDAIIEHCGCKDYRHPGNDVISLQTWVINWVAVRRGFNPTREKETKQSARDVALIGYLRVIGV
ncbi:putative acid-sensing ion channel 1-like [Apostichopus japonicus]|uniref:Putative acid-sensing ion channel 1-like n=1 Tax=Stichopus japonicus TaxID=307972 RepID=A0A2G8K8L4_STIJA|nr:putative acid-sensing ion channel 1-like [Apostichopus japonicus]